MVKSINYAFNSEQMYLPLHNHFMISKLLQCFKVQEPNIVLVSNKLSLTIIGIGKNSDSNSDGHLNYSDTDNITHPHLKGYNVHTWLKRTAVLQTFNNLIKVYFLWRN